LLKSSRNETKASILISGEELAEIQRQSYHFAESYGLDSRIDNYQGKRAISFTGWEFDSLFAVLEVLLEDPAEYPDRSAPEFLALESLSLRLRQAYASTFEPNPLP